ncbi:MAG: M24 family metallopeptidase, partial [Candidatus Aminicenantes bacterium]|nr:M24 family metallopeptidase [Candidatus Aminicenantes bacterium]
MAENSIDLLVAYSNLLDPSHGRYLTDVSPLNQSAAIVMPLDGDPILCSGQIRNTFPEAEIVNAEKLVYEMRETKTKNEIACMQKAACILDSAFAEAVRTLRAGMTELDIQAGIEAAILRGGAEDHGLSWTPMIPSGPERTKLCMNRNSLRKVKKGEIIDLQAGALYEGYNAGWAEQVNGRDVPNPL